MNKLPDISEEDDYFMQHYMSEPEPFSDSMPDDNHAKLTAHTAWYNEEDHKIASVVKVETTRFPLGAWMLTRMYLIMSTSGDSSWSVVARLMAYGNDTCVLTQFYPFMTNVTVTAGVYGIVEGCVIVYIDSLREDNNAIMCGVILPPTHHGPSYIGVPYVDAHFRLNIHPIHANLSGTKFVNAVEG